MNDPQIFESDEKLEPLRINIFSKDGMVVIAFHPPLGTVIRNELPWSLLTLTKKQARELVTKITNETLK